jgi:hypothetical protein
MIRGISLNTIMKKTTQKTYLDLEKIATAVKEQLRKKGLVIPIKLSDGTVSVDGFRIIKESSGFYSVTNSRNQTVVSNINLPQTAAVVANDLALGRWLDTDLVAKDKEYGYRLFEETLTKQSAQKNLKKNNIDRADLLFTKYKIAHFKTLSAKNHILLSFEKLNRLR